MLCPLILARWVGCSRCVASPPPASLSVADTARPQPRSPVAGEAERRRAETIRRNQAKLAELGLGGVRRAPSCVPYVPPRASLRSHAPPEAPSVKPPHGRGLDMPPAPRRRMGFLPYRDPWK